MTSLRSSSGSGDGGGGSSGSGGGRSSSRRGAVRWGVSGGGQLQLQRSQHETLSPQQLREWYARRSGGGGSSGSSCAAVQLRVSGGGLAQLQRHPCETLTPQQLHERAWQRGWLELLTQGMDIFALNYDAILTAMYALPSGTEGDCYLCVLPDPGREAAALRASKSPLPGIAPAEALHTFTLDSGASLCFFRDSTTLTPLSAPVPVRQADPSRGPVLARSSTVLPCPAVPSSSFSGLHLPSFSTNLVSTAALQDAMVTTTTPGNHRVSICTCTRTGRHLATFTRRPGSSLYTLATKPPQVAASAQVSASRQVAPPCSCRLLSHQTLLWHRRLGHPSLPRLRGMHSRLLVFGLPRSLPPLPPSPAPPCLPCVEGRQRAAPHSSSFPPTTAPLQSLHIDVWGPARISGQGREGYFLLVVDDYTRYTTVFPLRSKGHVVDVLIPWICTVRLHLRERFRQDLPILRLHSDRGGEFSSDLLRDFCRGEDILQTFTHWLSHGGRSYLHGPCGCSPFSMAVCGPVRCASAQPLAPCLLAGDFADTALDGGGWRCKFYHPTTHCVFPSQDVTFDESVPFYRLFPYRSAPPPPPPLFLATGPPSVDPLPPQGPAPSGVSQVDPLSGIVPVEVAVGSGAARGAASEGAASGGAEPGGAEPADAQRGSAEPVGVEPEGVEPWGAESGGAEPWGTASSVGPAGASTRLSPRPEPLSPQQLREWFTRHTRLRSGAAGAGNSAAGDTGAGGAGVIAGAGGTGGAATAGPGGARTVGTGAVGTGGVGGTGAGGAGAGGTGAGGSGAGGDGAGGAGAGGAGAINPRAGGVGAGGAGGTGAGDTVQPQPYFVPLLQQVLGVPSSTGLPPPLLCPPRDQSQPPLQPASSLPAPPYTEKIGGLTECREPASRLASHVRTGRRVPCPRPPPVPGTHAMALRTYVDAFPPSWANIVDGMWIFRMKRPPGSPPAFKAHSVVRGFGQRQWVDYFQTFSPTPKMTTLRVLLHVAAQRDYELHSLYFSTAFLQGSLHEEIWLRRPPGFTRLFPAGTQWSLQWPVYGLRQAPREWHDTLRTTLVALGFTPSIADPSLFLRTDMSLPPFYVLMYVDDLVFATADTEALTLVKLELQKRHTCTDLGALRSYLGLQITRDKARRTITLTQSHMVHQVLQRFGFQFSSPQPTSLSTGHSLSAPPSDESVELSGLYPELVGCLIYLMTSTRPDLAYPLCLLACYVAPDRHRKVHWDAVKRVLHYLCSTSGMRLVLGGRGPAVLTGHTDASWVDDSATKWSLQGYTFSLGSGSVSWRSTRSSSVLSSSCEAEIYARAMAAQELRWLTYLLTDLGEQPRLPPVLYVDNKTMIALCQEHRMEHRRKHIALQYFLARELQQRGQVCLAYVATRANTADIFTKSPHIPSTSEWPQGQFTCKVI
ncbi:unnamed protein product [Closterium sp. NIES-53]